MDSAAGDRVVRRVGEVLDRIMTIDVAGRGSIDLLYAAARRSSDLPLALQVAQALRDRVSPGDLVFMTTGFLVRGQFSAEIAESDGPPGVAVLARAIRKVCQGVPIVFVDPSIVSRVRGVMEAAGFCMVPPEKAKETAGASRRVTFGASVLPFPTDLGEAKARAEQLLLDHQPAAMISIERGGPNALGRIHTSQGADVTGHHARIDQLFDLARAMKNPPLVVCVGDGGNELGMGSLASELEKWLPYGRKCQCPCGGGIIPVSTADIVVAASVSNWGASAIAAALALLGNELEAGPSAELEARLLRRSAELGFVDGPLGAVLEYVDGMPAAASVSVASLLEQTVRMGLKSLTGQRLWALPEQSDTKSSIPERQDDKGRK